MVDYRYSVPLVWVTKYPYEVLTGDIQKRCRELLIQIYDVEDVRISSGVVIKDHIRSTLNIDHLYLYVPGQEVKRSEITYASTRIY